MYRTQRIECKPARADSAEAPYTSQDYLQTALDIWCRLRWSMMFVYRKKPLFKYGHLSIIPAGEHGLSKLFQRYLREKKPPDGVAVIFGAISGGLAARDWDDPEGYFRWAAENPNLAQALPTYRTSRGFQTLFRRHPEDELRNGKITSSIEKGELRVERVYSVLPPSRHPDGVAYRWITPEPMRPDDVPVVRIDEAGLWSKRLRSSTKQKSERRGTNTPRESSNSTPTHPRRKDHCGTLTVTHCRESEEDRVGKLIRDAILRSAPTGVGQRHYCILGLVMRLRAIDGVSLDNPVFATRVFDAWWELAAPVVRTQKTEVSYRELMAAWEDVPHGIWEGETGTAVAERLSMRLPECPIYGYRDDEPTRRLMAVCEVLQSLAGDRPFYLGCRDAARICGFKNHRTAGRRLNDLEKAGVLECEDDKKKLAGRDKRRAARYLYVASG